MSVQETDAAPETLNTSISVHERLASLERIVTSQQEEIAALHTELAAREASRTRALEATHSDGGTGATGVRRASRRSLLKLGGAAAAAGVAVAAGGLTGHTPSAHAAAELDSNYVQMGVNYQNQCATGTFLAPVSLSSPVILLDVNNQSSLTSDAGAACGVRGSGPSNSNGVIGIANGPSAYGVWGQTNSGFGVVGESSTGVALAAVGSGRFQQVAQAFAGAPTGGSWGAGEQIRDSRGDLWLCTVGGNPGTWVRVAVVANGALGGAITYLAAPIRLLDARSGATSGLVNRGPLGAGEIFALQVAGLSGSGIPSASQGVIGNLTVLGPGAAGNLSVFPDGAPIPTTASITFGAGAFLANSINSGIGASHDIDIQNQSGGSTPLVFDAVGYVL